MVRKDYIVLHYYTTITMLRSGTICGTNYLSYYGTTYVTYTLHKSMNVKNYLHSKYFNFISGDKQSCTALDVVHLTSLHICCTI